MQALTKTFFRLLTKLRSILSYWYMQNPGQTFLQARDRFHEQMRSYDEAGIPKALSPKVLFIHMEGAERRVQNALEQVSSIAGVLQLQEGRAAADHLIGRSGANHVLTVPKLDFDFEEVQTQLIESFARITAESHQVQFVETRLKDQFKGNDTVGPLDIPRQWRTCSVSCETMGFDRFEELRPEKCGFRRTSSEDGTLITRITSSLVDPRLTRVRLYQFLVELIQISRPFRLPYKGLLDLRFTEVEENN